MNDIEDLLLANEKITKIDKEIESLKNARRDIAFNVLLAIGGESGHVPYQCDSLRSALKQLFGYVFPEEKHTLTWKKPDRSWRDIYKETDRDND